VDPPRSAATAAIRGHATLASQGPALTMRDNFANVAGPARPRT
jgi:hypothetical protein